MAKIPGMNREKAEQILSRKTPDFAARKYNEEFVIHEEQINYYRKNGFIKIEKVFEGETLQFIKEIVEAAVYLRKESDERELKDKSAYQQSFLQCGFLAFDFAVIKELVLSKRLGSIARSLLEVEHVRLWHDQALFKEPNGRVTDVHVDSSYWPISNPLKSGTIWLALNDVPKEKGCLYFYPESQNYKREYVDIFNSPHTPEFIKDNEKIFVPLKAGDITFHSGLTYHGAGENKSSEIREGMTVIYISDGNKFTTVDERNATHKSCINLKDGDVINTIYTPIVI